MDAHLESCVSFTKARSRSLNGDILIKKFKNEFQVQEHNMTFISSSSISSAWKQHWGEGRVDITITFHGSSSCWNHLHYQDGTEKLKIKSPAKKLSDLLRAIDNISPKEKTNWKLIEWFENTAKWNSNSHGNMKWFCTCADGREFHIVTWGGKVGAIFSSYCTMTVLL